jgi:hypothetical protein
LNDSNGVTFPFGNLRFEWELKRFLEPAPFLQGIAVSSYWIDDK